MNNLYRQTFDQIALPENKAQEMRMALTSGSSRNETEDYKMRNQTAHTRPALRCTGTVLAAVLLICTLSISVFAYGGVQIYRLLTGGTVEIGRDKNGGYYASGSVDTDAIIPPVELREDGRLYLTINGENLDITDNCSDTEPYIYRFVAEDGLRHAIIVGGDLDRIGWSEFVWDEEGVVVYGHSQFGTSAGSDDAPWFKAGKDTLRLPW